MKQADTKKILFAIRNSFPFGEAYAARIRALCKLFQSIGYETVVLCDYLSDDADTDEYGIIIPLAKKSYSGAAKLLALPRDYQRKLRQVLNSDKYDFVVSSSMFDRFNGVLKVVRQTGIPIILESCEWFDIKAFKRGKKDIRYFQYKNCFNKSFKKVDGVIAISRLLEDHYSSKNIKTIRIPGIHVVKDIDYRITKDNEEPYSFIYAGNAGGDKELFEDLLIALSRIDQKFTLNIYGPSRNSIETSLSDFGKKCMDTLSSNIVFWGKVSQTEIHKACKNNDFGVFFRPDRRSSHAGFPTKLGEYLAAGTPVITNDTGDISMVVEDSVNGYLLSECNSDQIYRALESCFSLSAVEYNNMRIQARKTVEEKLDYSAYSEVLAKFLDEVHSS